jgi:hypothetical protein
MPPATPASERARVCTPRQECGSPFTTVRQPGGALWLHRTHTHTHTNPDPTAAVTDLLLCHASHIVMR